jgi:gamma-glutamylcyclotransferase (GGCT)/AIG2-like uncharacterized protein YtfP
MMLQDSRTNKTVGDDERDVRSRHRLGGGRLRLYFAYGANMVPEDMARRCPRARLVGTAVLADHRFAIIRDGHGTVLKAKGARVHGAAWRIGRADEAALDRFEEVARGLYRRTRTVVACRGRQVSALVYVAAATAPGRPRAAYIESIIAAARGFAFPADYIAALEAIARTSSAVRPASRSARIVSDGSLLA